MIKTGKTPISRTMSGDAIVSISVNPRRYSHDMVAGAIGSDIVTGRSPPGSRIAAEAELLTTFGVSRPVLREAIKTLAAKGLVTSKPKVGTVVAAEAGWNMFDHDVLAWFLEAGLGREFLRELAEMRLALEPRSAALAAERRTTAQLATMRACAKRMRSASLTSTDYAKADQELHLAIAAASGNRFMRSIGGAIEVALQVSFILSAPVNVERREKVTLAHADIVTAIGKRDPVGAAAAMRAVIRFGMDQLGISAPAPAPKRK